MNGEMPKDELHSHRRIITSFLADWGFQLAKGAILPVRFKYKYGLQIDFPNAIAITDHPSLNNDPGQTSEYFLRDCLIAAHESLWKTAREKFVEQNGGDKNMRHWDGNHLAHWAYLLDQDEAKAVSGEFVQKSYDKRCNVGFCGRISGQNHTLTIEHEEIRIKASLPSTVLESIRMQPFGEIFEGYPLCSDDAVNKQVAKIYVMKAEQKNDHIVFHMLDGHNTPMPSHNPADLWRRLRAEKPDTIMLQFPPYCDPQDVKDKAAAYRARLEILLSELPAEDDNEPTNPIRKAA